MGIPVPMLNIPPPHMMMSNPASALMPLNPFSAPPPAFNAQLFGNSVPAPITNTATDDHMDIEGEEEVTNINNKNPGKIQDTGHNNASGQKPFNQPPMGHRNDDRQSREHQNRRNSDNSDRNDRRHGNRWNSSEREDSYERDNRRGMRQRFVYKFFIHNTFFFNNSLLYVKIQKNKIEHCLIHTFSYILVVQ